ncbi:MAG: hypothetical protein WBW61_07550 [Rhodanobacteraceae bacterium]
MLQYQGTLALISALLACAYFVVASDASGHAKFIVTVLFLASLAIEYLLPQWALAGLLLQVALVVGVLMHAKATSIY